MKTTAPSPSAATAPRPALGVLSLLFLLPISAFAATFYVSPTGSDSNAGTQSAPFRSITKAQSVAVSGDIVLLRGGTYSSFTIAGSDSTYNFVHDITKSGITYAAYSGETPVFNFSSIGTAKRVAAFHIADGVSNVTFRGFQVTGVPVGTQKQSECFRIQGNAHFDRVVCHDNAANGFYFTTHGSGSCTNCDSYNNIGPTSASIGNTDGFGAHAYDVTFTGCRSWHNSDDGFDCISSTGQVVFDHCWAYNMTAGGDSNGFKVGGYGTSGAVASPMPSHIVKFCLSANNNANGFYANHQPGKSADWTNNTSYNNRNADYNMLEQASSTDRTDIPGYREPMHYNIAFTGTLVANLNESGTIVANNSWTSSVTVTSADFQSLDATQMTSARQADGSLPSIAFMRLVSGSDLAGMGCFQAGSSPITYQAESAVAAGGVTIDTNNAGYNGTGFANFPTSGGTLTFNNVNGNGGGAKSLAIRYANGGTTGRTGTITVNGVTSSITFNPTGAWSTWATLNVNITLSNSTTNTIQFASNGGDLGNIDEITVP
jgi:hypothetical protein